MSRMFGAAIVRGCRGKYRYDSACAARKHLYDLLRKGMSGKKKLLNAYRCADCAGWHVGHRSAS